MKIQLFFNLLFLSLSLNSLGQNQYVLTLKSEKWNLNPNNFFIADILDERKEKSSAGKVLMNGKIVKALFSESLESDLKKMIFGSIEQDTSKTPLVIAFERFSVNETGNAAHRKVKLDFLMTVFRTSNNNRLKLFEISGEPVLDIRGQYPNAHENNIQESIKNALISLNKWVNENPNQPLLCKEVKVSFGNTIDKNSSENNDTIIWRENYKLKWTDFKGNPTTSSFMAQSNCIFSYKAGSNAKDGIHELTIYLNAAFDRRGSWVRKDQQKDALLSHEQLHFDICELNIRRLKNNILSTNLDILDFDKQINSMFDQAWKKYQEHQQLYDAETGHGVILAEQKKWENEIAEQLRKISVNGIIEE